MAPRDLGRLQRRLGYRFTEPRLLEEALTHRSASARNNERLEFLGDGALNFVIAAELFHRYPDSSEGDLSRLRSSLVKGETLAQIGASLDLGNYLQLGSGELKSGGYRRESILADGVEALLGAIYLDANFERCREVVLLLYSDALNDINPKRQLKDPKTRLQEYLQARQLPLPSYDVEAIGGQPHNQLFKVICSISLLDKPIRGSGTSRRRAEQAAAERVLRILSDQKSE